MTARPKKLSELTSEDVDKMAAAQQAKAEAEAKARAERTERNAALAAWRAAGGDDASFDREWPQLRDEARRQKVLAQTGQAEAAARARLRMSL